MARSRHGRSRGEPSPAGSGLPSWAQRHLDEAGDPPTAAVAPALTSHRRRPTEEPSRLRGWGVAVVAVAAAVGAVPLAITSLANDHSDDPLPRVDTYTAGSPGPLPHDGGGDATGRRPVSGDPSAVGSDPATSGVLVAPPAAPAAPIVVPESTVPAAVVRSTPTPRPTTTPTTTTPRSTTPTTTTSTEGDGRSATKAPPKTSTSPSKPAPPQQAPPPKQSGGLLSNTVRGVGNAVGGVTDAAGDALGGL